MEMVVVPNIDVVKRGVLIEYVAKLGGGLSGILVVRNLNQSSALLIATTRIVGTLQMVFTNLIMNTHVNMITNQPLMSLMVIGRYKSANVANPRGGYRKPFDVIAPILDHRDGCYVRPNRVALKYPDFKKDADPDAHVRMFNFVIKANAETSKKYIINVFSYTLRDTTLN